MGRDARGDSAADNIAGGQRASSHPPNSAPFGGAFLRSVYVPRPGATLVRPLFRNKAGERQQYPAAASKGPTRCSARSTGAKARGALSISLCQRRGGRGNRERPKPNKKRALLNERGVTEARYSRTRQRAGQCAPVPSARWRPGIRGRRCRRPPAQHRQKTWRRDAQARGPPSSREHQARACGLLDASVVLRSSSSSILR